MLQLTIQTLKDVIYENSDDWEKLVECPEVHRVAITTYRWEAK